MEQALLTIAIPTYKRAALLDRCMKCLLAEIDFTSATEIEILVLDNDSQDNTADVVDKYIKQGYPIKYFKSTENVGPDRNIAGCFTKATGKYVWIFSDDDYILPGYLPLIIKLLKENDLGNVYIKSLWYANEYKHTGDVPSHINYNTYTNPMEFVEQVNYWSTFITGNIINKSAFPYMNQISDFYDSYLVQLSWILPVIFIGKKNVIITDQAVACISDNTGGYKLLNVFGQNLNGIVDELISKKQIDKKVKRIINQHLLSEFFPMFISADKKFEKENPFKILLPVLWSYKLFWTGIFPKITKSYIKSLVRND